jgi:hypothetical protein
MATLTPVQIELLSRVQEWCRDSCRWHITRRGERYRKIGNQPADRLLVLEMLRDQRGALGPRWLNPVAWGVGLKIISFRDATALTVIGKQRSDDEQSE